jgi:hypothetical protein
LEGAASHKAQLDAFGGVLYRYVLGVLLRIRVEEKRGAGVLIEILSQMMASRQPVREIGVRLRRRHLRERRGPFGLNRLVQMKEIRFASLLKGADRMK